MSAERTYDRTWEEIEAMLGRAERKMTDWKGWVEECRQLGDREGRKDAVRNYKALEGVIKTLKWTLGDVSIDTPLE